MACFLGRFSQSKQPPFALLGKNIPLIISGTVTANGIKWKLSSSWKFIIYPSLSIIRPYVFSNLQGSVPLALLLLFLTVLLSQSRSHGRVQEQNIRLSKTTYQRPNSEKRWPPLASSWKTDRWQIKEKCTKLHH